MGGRAGKGLGNKRPWGKQELQPKSLRETTGHEWPLALDGFKRMAITLAVLTISHREDDTYGTTVVIQEKGQHLQQWTPGLVGCSAVKSCSCKEPEFNSQHLLGSSQLELQLQLQEIRGPLLAFCVMPFT